MQRRVSVVHVVFPLAGALDVAGIRGRRRPAAALAADREPLHQRPVDAHVERVRLAEAADVVIELPLQADADGVGAVQREVVLHLTANRRKVTVLQNLKQILKS